ncbi:TPA: hypothetical protein ACQVLR_005306, partial [Serratia marcescens]
QEETERFARMVKSMGNSEEPLRRLITIVITDFYQKLDASGKESINNKLAYGAGRLGGRTGGPICIGAICGSHDAKESDLRISV